MNNKYPLLSPPGNSKNKKQPNIFGNYMRCYFTFLKMVIMTIIQLDKKFVPYILKSNLQN